MRGKEGIGKVGKVRGRERESDKGTLKESDRPFFVSFEYRKAFDSKKDNKCK